MKWRQQKPTKSEKKKNISKSFAKTSDNFVEKSDKKVIETSKLFNFFPTIYRWPANVNFS